MAEGKVTDLRDMAQMLASGARAVGRYVIRNADLGRWFSPGQPLQPQAQGEADGRRFDFPVGYNLRTVPRQDEPVTFATLRGLADSLDVLRLLIETRKDQLCRLEWQIRPRDDGDQDARCDAIADMLRYPDQTHDWQTWLRAVLEDMLVIDAATIYPRRTMGGDVWGLVQIDGALIVPKIDYFGMTPLPPDPAYQHMLKGVPAVDYSLDELIYKPRNVRAHKVYGFSPVEQIIMTVETALRRQVWQLQSYTEGNTPEALIGVPETWTPDQIKTFQTYWDSLLEGNTAQRRHSKFVPGGMNYIPTKPAEMYGPAEEWLARVCCFAFSVSPQAFVQEVNRATAETAKATADEEGIAPHAAWVKGLMDYILARHMAAPDLEFAWVEDEDTDPKVQAEVDQIYINAGVYSPAYVADRLGIEAKWIPEEAPAAASARMALEAKAQQGVQDQGKAAGDASDDEAKVEKASKKKDLKPLSRDRQSVAQPRKALAELISKAFKSEAPKVAEQIAAALSLTEKADEDAESRAAAILAGVDLSGLEALAEPAGALLSQVAAAGVADAYQQIGMSIAPRFEGHPEGEQAMLKLANEDGIKWAKDRAAAWVGKRREGALLVENDRPTTHGPGPTWEITTSTREQLNGLVVQAMEEGWSATKLGKAITKADAFSPERAMMISRTETAFADTQGNVALYRRSGLVKKKSWLTAQDDHVSPDCVLNGKAGAIDFDAPFPSGEYWPPDHPRCRCSLLPHIEDHDQ